MKNLLINMKRKITSFKQDLYNENSKYNKITLPFFVLLVIILLNTVIVFNLYANKKDKDDILRLHVVANSNDISDQIVKLKIQSKINDYINNNFNSNDDKNKIINDIKLHADDIISLSNEVLDEKNINYGTTLKIGKINYDEKISQILTMDKGIYNSVQIILGEGNGKNIWSLIFPNENSINNISSLDSILPGISDLFKTQNDMESENENIEYDFKILEIIRKII